MSAVQLNLPLEFDTRRLLRCSMPRVESDLHHLTRDSKGWLLRVTVTAMNRKGIVTKRLRIRLGKEVRTEREAVIARDAAIRAFRGVGLRVSERRLVRGCRRDP
jgi:hypothetical protein